MKKFFSIVIPGCVLLIFIFIMNSSYILLKPFGEKDDVKTYINNINDNINHDRWLEAEENMDKLKKAWVIIEKRVQVSIEKDLLDDFERSIFELDSKLKVKDKKEALSKVIVSLYIWDELS